MEKYLKALSELKFATEQQEMFVREQPEETNGHWWVQLRKLHQIILLKHHEVKEAYSERLD